MNKSYVTVLLLLIVLLSVAGSVAMVFIYLKAIFVNVLIGTLAGAAGFGLGYLFKRK